VYSLTIIVTYKYPRIPVGLRELIILVLI